MSWLQEHLERFVEPYLGFIPDTGALYFLEPELTVIKNCWRSAKASAMGKKIVLPGRDVFVFEVLARRENYPTIFLPECSRETVLAIQLEGKENLYLLDTGFMGSIPRGLRMQSFGLVSYADRLDKIGKQVFPRLTLSRNLAMRIERTPKYWETGRLADGKIIQNFSRKEEFAKAAQLTIEIYKNSARKFVEKSKPLGGGLWTEQ